MKLSELRSKARAGGVSGHYAGPSVLFKVPPPPSGKTTAKVMDEMRPRMARANVVIYRTLARRAAALDDLERLKRLRAKLKIWESIAAELDVDVESDPGA